MITRGGQVEAVVVPLEEYRALKALELRETELYWAVHEARYPSRPGYDKINAHAQLTLSRPSESAPEWTIAIRLGGDLWTWQGVGFLGFWQLGSVKLSAAAYIYTYSDWHRPLSTRTPTPIASVGGTGSGSGQYGGEYIFEHTIPLDTGQYVCVWWIARGEVGNPKDTIAGQQLAGRSDAVTVNGEIQFGSGAT